MKFLANDNVSGYILIDKLSYIIGMSMWLPFTQHAGHHLPRWLNYLNKNENRTLEMSSAHLIFRHAPVKAESAADFKKSSERLFSSLLGIYPSVIFPMPPH